MNRTTCLVMGGFLTALSVAVVYATGDKPLPVIKSSTELEQMKSLSGKWVGPNAMNKDGGQISVEYHVIANGSAVEEKLFPETPHSMVSVYYDNDGKMMMTHYCAMGNRPEMKVTKATKDEIDLSFVPTPGIDASKDAYMNALSLSFPDEDHLIQNWHAMANGKEQPQSTFNLTRVK